MVAAEARARASLEMDRKRLEIELQATKEQLALERQQLHELRGRLSSSSTSGAPTAATIEGSEDTASLTTAIRGTAQINLRMIDALKCTIDQHNYFGCLLPRHRFNSRDRCDGPAGGVWDRISDNLARYELPEFSRFVERSSGMDAETLLAHPYVRGMCETDVVPCLHFEFKPKPFVKRVALAMLRNTCCVERTPQAPHLSGALPIADGAHSRLSSAASVGTPGSMSVGAYPDSPVKSPLGGSLSGGAEGDGAGVVLPVPESKKSPTAIEHGGQRLRGIMSQFTTSVTSLPEALLANMNPTSSGGAASGTQSVNSPSSSGGSAATAKFCALCGKSALHDAGLLQYRVRLSDSEAWMLIDRDCRERLVAAGHFFTFLRHLHSGLYSHRPLLDLYCDLLHFRRHMFYVRLAVGATMFFLQSDLESYLDMITPHLLLAGSRPTAKLDAAKDTTDEGEAQESCDDPNDDIAIESSTDE